MDKDLKPESPIEDARPDQTLFGIKIFFKLGIFAHQGR
jgi:hypothetical protein